MRFVEVQLASNMQFARTGVYVFVVSRASLFHNVGLDGIHNCAGMESRLGPNRKQTCGLQWPCPPLFPTLSHFRRCRSGCCFVRVRLGDGKYNGTKSASR